MATRKSGMSAPVALAPEPGAGGGDPRRNGQAIEGLKALAKNGIRYPIASYGIQNDVRAGLAASYRMPG